VFACAFWGVWFYFPLISARECAADKPRLRGTHSSWVWVSHSAR
jgi:hypothetical protein